MRKERGTPGFHAVSPSFAEENRCYGCLLYSGILWFLIHRECDDNQSKENEKMYLSAILALKYI